MTGADPGVAVGHGPAGTGRVTQRAGKVLALLAGLLICGLMILTVLDVLGRSTTSGIDGSLEFTEVLLVATVFVGMASAQIQRVHVSTPILTDRLPGRAATIARAIGKVVVVVFLVWAAVATAETGWESFQAREYRFGIAEVPVWPAKLVIPLGFAAFALVVIAQLSRDIRDLLSSRGGRAAADTPGKRDGDDA